MKSITIILNGLIDSYINDLIEQINHEEYIWYYAPSSISDIEAKVRVSSGEVNLSLDINGQSISDSDPLIRINKSGCELISQINPIKNKLKVGDRISIRTLKAIDSKDLSLKFSYVTD